MAALDFSDVPDAGQASTGQLATPTANPDAPGYAPPVDQPTDAAPDQPLPKFGPSGLPYGQHARAMQAYYGVLDRHPEATPAAAIGVAANFLAETGADHTKTNPDSGASGGLQWLGPRKRQYISLYGHAPAEGTLTENLDFLALENNTSEADNWKTVAGEHDPIAAARKFRTNWERPGRTPAEVAKEEANAAHYARMLWNGLIGGSAQAAPTSSSPPRQSGVLDFSDVPEKGGPKGGKAGVVDFSDVPTVGKEGANGAGKQGDLATPAVDDQSTWTSQPTEMESRAAQRGAGIPPGPLKDQTPVDEFGNVGNPLEGLPDVQPGGAAPEGSAQPKEVDLTKKYNTPLTSEEKPKYEAWLKAKGYDPAKASFDYDMQGAWKSGAAQSENGHLPDTFKKPNHPTFSDQSQYNGADGTQGGTWAKDVTGAWTFTPGQTNLQTHGMAGLSDYFQRVEPGNVLLAPGAAEATRTTAVDENGNPQNGPAAPATAPESSPQAGLPPDTYGPGGGPSLMTDADRQASGLPTLKSDSSQPLPSDQQPSVPHPSAPWQTSPTETLPVARPGADMVPGPVDRIANAAREGWEATPNILSDKAEKYLKDKGVPDSVIGFINSPSYVAAALSGGFKGFQQEVQETLTPVIGEQGARDAAAYLESLPAGPHIPSGMSAGARLRLAGDMAREKVETSGRYAPAMRDYLQQGAETPAEAAGRAQREERQANEAAMSEAAAANQPKPLALPAPEAKPGGAAAEPTAPAEPPAEPEAAPAAAAKPPEREYLTPEKAARDELAEAEAEEARQNAQQAAPVTPEPTPEVTPESAAKPTRIRTLQQIMDEDGISAAKARTTQEEEIEAIGKPISMEEMGARKAGVPSAKPVVEKPVTEATPPAPDVPQPVPEPTGQSPSPAPSGAYVMVTPDQLTVDPERFQYKASGEGGVTGALQGVERWETGLANPITAWQGVDGKLYVVNGHQRTDLATRAVANGQTDVQMPARVYREADGYTPEYMKRLGAYQNIAEGSGTALDAAKVMRGAADGPAEFRLPDLPPRSQLVQQGKALANLSDQAFGVVENGIVPEAYAAHVGAMIKDPTEQMAALDVLARAHPPNSEQARLMVKDVRDSGFLNGSQTTLFGEEAFSHSLIPERARVLDNAMRTLRRMTGVFRAAVEGEDTLAGAGVSLHADASDLKRSHDSLLGYSKLFADLSKGDARAAQFLGSLDAPAKRLMLSGVFGAAHDLKIVPAVIQALPVDVMDQLRARQISPERFLHDSSVFHSVLAGDLESPVAIPVKEASRVLSVIGRVAGTATKDALASHVAGKAGEGASAERTISGNHGQTVANSSAQTRPPDAAGRLTQAKSENARLLDILQRDATTRGPISDALSVAARELADGKPVAGVASRFLAATRGIVARSGQEGVQSGAAPGGQEHSAQGEPGPDEQPGLAGVSESPVPLFSAVERATEGLKQARGTGEQMLSQIMKTPGVKPEEVKWMGLDDWLKGQKTVTRDQIADFVRANNLDVQEVVHGNNDADVQKVKQEVEALGLDYGNTSINSLERAGASEDLIDRFSRYIVGEPGSQGTKYAEYTLPGGENYREMLITLPVKTSPKAMEADELTRRMNAGEFNSLPRDQQQALFARRDALLRQARAEEGGNYQSSHWQEPNVVAHIRFNERTAPDGKKVLLVEEVQSDWHQAGRRGGYRMSDAEAQQLATREQELIAKGRDATPAEKQEWADIRNRQQANGNAVPDAPFKTIWPALAMRRVTKFAVDNGFDRVAWPPGQVHADRYDLSQQISRVELHDNHSGGVGRPEMEGPFTRGSVRAFDHDGRRVIDKSVESPRELADTVGKETADKLLAAPAIAANHSGIFARRRTLSGLDLKVGGEGMAGFYDKILPAETAKIIGKFGAKIGKSEVQVGHLDRDKVKPDAQAIADHGPEWDRVTAEIKELESQRKPYSGNTPEENRLYDRLDQLHEKMIDDTMERGKAQEVHSFDVTPQMRDVVRREGLSLFERRPPIPSGPDLFGAVKPERARPTAEPTIRTDQRQQLMPGMEPSAVQAQAARDQTARGALNAKVPQKSADEGLFSRPQSEQPNLTPEPLFHQRGAVNLLDTVPSGGDPTVVSRDWVLSKGKDGKEYLTVVGPAGDIVMAISGGKANLVPIDLRNVRHMPDDSIVIHHNHPAGSSFSGDDLAIGLTPQVRTMVVHTTDNVFVATSRARLPDGWTESQLAAAQHRIKVVQKAAAGAVKGFLTERIKDGKLSVQEASDSFWDMVNRSLHAHGQIDYVSTRAVPASIAPAWTESLRGVANGDRARLDGATNAVQRDKALAGVPVGGGGAPRSAAAVLPVDKGRTPATAGGQRRTAPLTPQGRLLENPVPTGWGAVEGGHGTPVLEAAQSAANAVAKMLGGKVRVAVVDGGLQIENANGIRAPRLVGGYALGRLIRSELSPNTPWVLNHEAIHALRNLGVFTPHEWSLLEKAAEKEDWLGQHKVEERYGALSKDKQIEEAIADHFGHYSQRPDLPKSPLLTRMMDKLRDWMRRLRSYMRGDGFRTAEDVFGDVESGKVGAREPGSGMEQRGPRSIEESVQGAKIMHPQDMDVRLAATPTPPGPPLPPPAGRTPPGTSPGRPQRQRPLPMAPGARGAVLSEMKGWRKAVGEMKAALSPTSLEGAKPAEQMMRKHGAEQAQSFAQVINRLEKARDDLHKLSKDEQIAFTDNMEKGLPQANPELDAVATALRETIDDWTRKIQSLGKGHLANAIENYMGHIYGNYKEWAAGLPAPSQVEIDAQGRATMAAKKPMLGSGNFLKKRSFPTQKEAIDAGLIPITYNPVDLQLMKLREMQKFYHGTKLADKMKSTHMAVWVPAGREGDASAEGLVKLDDKVFQPRLMGDANPAGFGRLEPGNWYAPEAQARIFNRYMSQGISGRSVAYDVVRGAGNALNSLQLGFSGFHATFVALDTALSRAALGLHQVMRPGQRLQGLGNVALGGIPGLNVAGLVRTVHQGAQLRKAWLDPQNATPEWAKLAEDLNRGGGRDSMDTLYQTTNAGSFFKHLSDLKNPLSPLHQAAQMFRDAPNWQGRVMVPLRLVGRVLDTTMQPLMGWLVPRAKVGVFAEMARSWNDANPHATDAQRSAEMIKIWDSVENRLGQMTYDNVFWHKMLKDTAFVATRSVGWNLGTWRELGGAAVDTAKMLNDAAHLRKPEFTYRQSYAIVLPIMTAVIGSIINYLGTGEAPQEMKDLYFPRIGGEDEHGQPRRLNIPGYMKDVISFYHEPATTIANKLHPLVSAGVQWYQNRDYYGGIIHNPETDNPGAYLDFMINTAQPFALRAMRKSMEQEIEPAVVALNFFGFQPPAGWISNPERSAKFEHRTNQQGLKRRNKEQGTWHIFNASPND